MIELVSKLVLLAVFCVWCGLVLLAYRRSWSKRSGPGWSAEPSESWLRSIGWRPQVARFSGELKGRFFHDEKRCLIEFYGIPGRRIIEHEFEHYLDWRRGELREFRRCLKCGDEFKVEPLPPEADLCRGEEQKPRFTS